MSIDFCRFHITHKQIYHNIITSYLLSILLYTMYIYSTVYYISKFQIEKQQNYTGCVALCNDYLIYSVTCVPSTFSQVCISENRYNLDVGILAVELTLPVEACTVTCIIDKCRVNDSDMCRDRTIVHVYRYILLVLPPPPLYTFIYNFFFLMRHRVLI